MMTIRQIERLWDVGDYRRMLGWLLSQRIEASQGQELLGVEAVAAAAMGMIRLDELNQSHVPLFSELLMAVLSAEQEDGGWQEIAPTALCLRALMIDQGEGRSIARGLVWLGQLQQSGGAWPRIPIRRMAADPEVTAWVLFELGDSRRFREAVRFREAMNWMQTNSQIQTAEARKLWMHARLRCGTSSFNFAETSEAMGR